MSLIDPITYSNKGSFVTRVFVSMVEYMTGRLKLEKLYRVVDARYKAQPETPFFNYALEALAAKVAITQGSLDNIPQKGPLIIVSNHPFGVLDGLALNHIIYERRTDFKILTNEVLTKADPMRDWLIAIDDSESVEGTKKNNRAIRAVMRMVYNHQCIGIFPAGRLARPRKRGGTSVDWDWKPLVGHLAGKCRPKDGAPLMILPIFFEGENSGLFKFFARWKFFTITRSLVIRELVNKQGKTISVRIGKAFPAADILAGSAEETTIALRSRTLDLGGGES